MQVPIEKLWESSYLAVLCYPKAPWASRAETKSRLIELKELGVESLEFSGQKRVFSIPILGKGCVGLVITVYRKGEKNALKILRLDADRASMEHEAVMLQKANQINVGPRFLGVTRSFLVTQFINGDLLPKWINKSVNKHLLRRGVRDIFEQCWRLDNAHLDHGELSTAHKHVIIDNLGKPFILDFETASITRKTANVTSMCHFLFVNHSIAKKMGELFGQKSIETIIEASRQYKRFRTRKTFERLMGVLNL